MYGYGNGPIRGNSPCAGCENRATACWGKCKKYSDWKNEIQRIKDNRKKYIKQLYVRYKNFKESNG